MNNINNMKIENFLAPDELKKLYTFFEKIYYENDLIQYGNCYDYNEGHLDIFEVIDIIAEYNLQIMEIKLM